MGKARAAGAVDIGAALRQRLNRKGNGKDKGKGNGKGAGAETKAAGASEGETEVFTPYDEVDGLDKLRELVVQRQMRKKHMDRLQKEVEEKTAAILVMLQQAEVKGGVTVDEWVVRVTSRKGEKLDEKKLLQAGVSATLIAKCKTPWESDPYVEVRTLPTGRRDVAVAAPKMAKRRGREVAHG